MVKLSDGGWLIAKGSTIHRCNRRGQIVETRKPGDSGYSTWVFLVFKHDDQKEPPKPSR